MICKHLNSLGDFIWTERLFPYCLFAPRIPLISQVNSVFIDPSPLTLLLSRGLNSQHVISTLNLNFLNSNTLATWLEGLTHLKRLLCWERLKAGREGDDRGWDGWMASATQRTWVCINSRSWWWTGRPGVLRFMGSQRVGCDRVTALTDVRLKQLSWTGSMSH